MPLLPGMIPVDVVGVQVAQATGVPFVLLREREGDQRVLLISIGGPEAVAIAIGLKGARGPRPMTHDLFVDVIREMDVTVDQVEVTELHDGTFYAEVELQGAHGVKRVSSRPSDAIALAVRMDIPVFVAETVLDEAGAVLVDSPDEEQIEEEVQEFREFLDEVDPSQFGEGGDLS